MLLKLSFSVNNMDLQFFGLRPYKYINRRKPINMLRKINIMNAIVFIIKIDPIIYKVFSFYRLTPPE